MPVAHPLQHAPRSREVLQHTYHFTELQIRAQLPRPAYIIELQNSELARHHTARPPPPAGHHLPNPARARKYYGAHFRSVWNWSAVIGLATTATARAQKYYGAHFRRSSVTPHALIP